MGGRCRRRSDQRITSLVFLVSTLVTFEPLLALGWVAKTTAGQKRRPPLFHSQAGKRPRRCSSPSAVDLTILHGPTLRQSRLPLKSYKNDNDNDDDEHKESSAPSATPLAKIRAVVLEDPNQSLVFSLLMTFCGALLGPFLDAYHSAFGVLQYDKPLTAVLWGSTEHPALTTAWWVPELFGLAGFLIGWLYILFDVVLLEEDKDARHVIAMARTPSTPKILLGISFFTLQYWLSGILFQAHVGRTTILNLMSVLAAAGFVILDGTTTGFWVSLATCLGGPLIEVGLISAMTDGGYHYTDMGETGFFPLWIVPVYYLGGPTNGNLARGFWTALSPAATTAVVPTPGAPSSNNDGAETCFVCNDTRRDMCPNCDGVGTYMAMGNQRVKCTSCRGKGFVMCRACFGRYQEDPYSIDSIREFMDQMPD